MDGKRGVQMKVLLVSTSDISGGGAIAAFRLMEALNDNGVEAKMLVREKRSSSASVIQTGTIMPKVLERLQIMSYMKGKLWQADTARFGIDITRTEVYREADVIHLHWINQGMVSLSCLERMIKDGKKIVWTLHDEWPFLGICHYRGTCQEVGCRECPLLPGSIARKCYLRKQELYGKGNIAFVGCSEWITQRARQAMPGADVTHINNCIPRHIFHPMDQQEARKQLGLPLDRKTILFCSQNLNDERKGYTFLLQALKTLSPLYTTLCIGKGARYISSPQEMATAYAAADVFVTPSLEDNLPNTIAEAMSCGTPCVGFRTGGIPEMIDHQQNGYVARHRDVSDLAEGIRYVLSHSLHQAAQQKAAAAYDETQVAQQYINVYESRQ